MIFIKTSEDKSGLIYSVTIIRLNSCLVSIISYASNLLYFIRTMTGTKCLTDIKYVFENVIKNFKALFPVSGYIFLTFIKKFHTMYVCN